MPWETLLTLPTAVVRRYGRFVVADLKEPCLVLSTSARNGGQVGDVRHIVNHQSCEGAGHAERARFITDRGQEAYHDAVCDELGLPSTRPSSWALPPTCSTRRSRHATMGT